MVNKRTQQSHVLGQEKHRSFLAIRFASGEIGVNYRIGRSRIMFETTTAAYIFSLLTVIVMLFQMALALGAPWGEMAMGGKFPGRFSPILRISAIVQMLLLAFAALIVLTRAGLVLDDYFEFSKSAVWFVVVLCVISAILNTITPSKKERVLWSPVTIILVVCAVVVARS